MNPALSEKSGLFHWIEERLMFKSDQMPRFSVAISFVLSFIGISCIGFQLGDSDLWFHLNEGRQLFATGTIPSTSFFSYIEPARHWVNYAWLFQSICYKIFIHTGYFGLILLRSLVYVFIGLIIYRIFSKDGTSNIIVNLAFVLCFLCVMPRSLVVRPHIFTYLFILLSICTFERKQKFWILPIIFLLEANIHGIAYPFLLLVWGAYFLEYYVQSKRRKDIGIDNKQLICAAIAPVFLLFSPQGYHILPLPFENAASFVRYYIMEMQPPSFSGVLHSFSGQFPACWAAFESFLFFLHLLLRYIFCLNARCGSAMPFLCVEVDIYFLTAYVFNMNVFFLFYRY